MFPGIADSGNSPVLRYPVAGLASRPDLSPLASVYTPELFPRASVGPN
jgi:hypothetical protein